MCANFHNLFNRRYLVMVSTPQIDRGRVVETFLFVPWKTDY